MANTRFLAGHWPWLLLVLLPLTEATIGEDGLCNLFIFVPFTYGYVRLDGLVLRFVCLPLTTFSPLLSIFNSEFPTRCPYSEIACANPGFTQMSAALLAMEVFNARNASVVPELGGPVFQDCDLQMDIENSLVFDTQSYGHQAAQSFSNQVKLPCAMVGASNDIPAQELSVLATSHKIPFTVSRAFNLRVISDDHSPYSSQIFPYLPDSARNLVDYLLLRGRTDYIATVYALTDTGTQRSETISLLLGESEIVHAMLAFASPNYQSFQSSVRSAMSALEQVKNTGFRTIILSMEFAHDELPLIADAAEELGLNNGKYMWIIFGEAEPGVFHTNNANVTKLLRGSARLSPIGVEGHLPTSAWSEQGSSLVDKANTANPLEPGETGYFFAEPDYFQTYGPQYGDDLMFDAVMATAMGACLAGHDSGNTSGLAHVKGIRSVDFQGASGQVKFERGSDGLGARETSTIVWGVYNFNLLSTTEEGFLSESLTDISFNGTWSKLDEFVYADGTTIPPELLRDLPDQNYLTAAFRSVGLTLMGITMSGAVATIVWVYLHREHRVLRAAQPPFLYMLALGSAVSVSTILVISFDESTGRTEEQLSSSCMAIPWLISLGHILTYGALFSKLWRVNKVLQFSRRTITTRQVVWPFAILAFVKVMILSLWTALDSLHWIRVEVNTRTGESIGECKSEHMAAFLGTLVTVMLIPTVLTAYMAWKTKDIDEAYSESKWIFMMIIFQIEIIFVAVPTIFVLRESSAEGKYIGFAILLWSFPSSTLGFIILPKVVAYYRALRGHDLQPKRGVAIGSVQVTGLTSVPESSANEDLQKFISSHSQAEVDVGMQRSRDTAAPPELNNPGEAGKEDQGRLKHSDAARSNGE
jgi:hypothetical protein